MDKNRDIHHTIEQGYMYRNAKQFDRALDYFLRAVKFFTVELAEAQDESKRAYLQQSLKFVTDQANVCKTQIQPEVKRNRAIGQRIIDAQPKLYSVNKTPEDVNELVLLTHYVFRSAKVEWEDIMNQEHPKSQIQKLVQPLLWRNAVKMKIPSRGVLVFGPPGNGKSMLCKALANTEPYYLGISGEKVVSAEDPPSVIRAMFRVALRKQPTVLFIEKIHAIFASRAVNDFLSWMDNITDNDRVLVIGETSLLDHVSYKVKSRFRRRILVEAPNQSERFDLILRSIRKDNLFGVSDDEIRDIALMTHNYSYAEIIALVTQAKFSVVTHALPKIVESSHVPLVTYDTFREVLKNSRPTMTAHLADFYLAWNNEYGN